MLNKSQAPIEFDLNINKPFYFSNFTNSTERLTLKQNSKLKVHFLKLLQQQFSLIFNLILILKVDVLFKFDLSLIRQLDFLDSNQALLKDFVKINFSRDFHQPIPIGAKIYAPEIQVTRNAIDFGTTLVSQERQEQFLIRNHSFSSFLWNIVIGYIYC